MSRKYYNKFLRYVKEDNLLENADKFRKVFRAPFVRQIVKDIIRNEDLLQKIAQSSYSHYNGFDKIVLFSNENFKVRLHSWDSNLFTQELDENIHNHRWDFVTNIICGGYDLELYQIAKKGNSFHQYLYIPPEGKEFYSMEYVGLKFLKLVLNTRLQANNHYEITKDVFHKVTPAVGLFTVTLMIHGKNYNEDVYVFSKNKIEQEDKINSKSFTKKELKMRLKAISKNLKKHIKYTPSIARNIEDPNEILDIVDKNDIVVGKLPRVQIYENKIKNFRVINAFLENEKGELLILRRSADKAIFPLGLDMSVGGHVTTGENYDKALERELKEELNLNLKELEFNSIGYLTPYNSKLSAFSKIYKINYNSTPEYNKDEFLEHYWMKPKEVLNQIENGDLAKDDLPTLIKLFFQEK